LWKACSDTPEQRDGGLSNQKAVQSMSSVHILGTLSLVTIGTSLWLAGHGAAASIRRSDDPPAPIQETRFVTLGGIQQWITIRGADRANPVLLVVHGGPGDPQSSLRSTYAVYEKDFTIVQWDQRGAGKTYAMNPSSPPEPERVVSDGIELAQYLCGYLAKRKVLLLGWSWGSYLAIGMVQRRPGLFSAYIGTGQVGSWRVAVRAQFDFLLARARAARDHKRVEQLEAIGTPDPADATQYFSWWRMRNPYTARADAEWLEHLAQLVRSMPEAESRALEAGMEYSARTVLPTVLAQDLPTTARTLEVPFVVIQGKEDMATPTSVAVEYFNVVSAPKKKLILIDHAGHFALVTHRDDFLAALVRHVRPIAVESERGR
jgi:pimeloyl-ACP methyl ester carboxylesterase